MICMGALAVRSVYYSINNVCSCMGLRGNEYSSQMCFMYWHRDMCSRLALRACRWSILPYMCHGLNAGTLSADPHVLLEQGGEAMKAQDFESAVQIYERLRDAAQGTAGEAIALLRLGNAYGAWGKEEQAAAALIDVASVNAADGRTLLRTRAAPVAPLRKGVLKLFRTTLPPR